MIKERLEYNHLPHFLVMSHARLLPITIKSAYAKTNRPAAAARTSIMLDPDLEAAPVNGVVLPVGEAMTAELLPAATPGTPAAGAEVAAACAGAGPATRPTLDEGPVDKATWGTVTAV